MANRPRSPKRKPLEDEQLDVSPPPLKRRVISTTNQDKVSSFFTPMSQKQPDATTWRTVNESLLIARYDPGPRSPGQNLRATRQRIAAFDLDSTLITSASGKKFSKDSTDWKWWHASVPGELKRLDEDGFQVIIITNQGGLGLKSSSKAPKIDQKRVADFKSKVSAVLNALNLPISVYAATRNDEYRKPRDGMFEAMREDYDLDVGEGVDVKESIFVGDAAGRIGDGAGQGVDFASSDRDFAENTGLPFKTPEEFFLKESPKPYRRAFEPSKYLSDAQGATQVSFCRTNTMDLVLLCGSPGSGKSTFYWTHLAPLGYKRVNQDILKTVREHESVLSRLRAKHWIYQREKCLSKAREHLLAKQSVAVDNTNADREVRSKWIALAKEMGVPVRCVFLRVDTRLAEHNDTVRAHCKAMNPEQRTLLPKAAFHGFAARFQKPEKEEGFQDVTTIEFCFSGSEEKRRAWARFWV